MSLTGAFGFFITTVRRAYKRVWGELMADFAVLSHILPPSPSGQAMVLAQLLEGFAPARYCLISWQRYADGDHAAKYYHLGAPAGSSRLTAVKRVLLPRLPSPLVRIYKRAHEIKQARARAALPDHAAITEARAAQLTPILDQEGCRLLIACTGDLYDLPAGFRAAQRAGIAFAPYIFDYYAYQWTGAARDFALQHEPALIKGAAGVIAPNEFMAAAYREHYGIESVIIRNPAALPDCAALDRAPRCFDADTVNIVYTGAVYHAQFDAFRNLIAAAKRLERGGIRIRLHIFTNQPPTWLAAEGIEGLNVVFHAHIPHTEIAAIQRQADVLFLPLAFESSIPEMIKTSAPGKMGEYLAAGRPILVHAPADSFVSWYFRAHGCGVVVDQNDPAALAAALKRLLADEGRRRELGRRAVERAVDFDIERVRPQFVQFVEGVLS